MVVASYVPSLQLAQVTNWIKRSITGLVEQKCQEKVHKAMFHVTRPSCRKISSQTGGPRYNRYNDSLSMADTLGKADNIHSYTLAI